MSSLHAISRPEVVHGTASYQGKEGSEIIHASDQAMLRYPQFHLKEKESLAFHLPSSKATLLCEVMSQEPALINGSLHTNGKVIFVSPSGILFSKTADISGHSWVFSTLALQQENFLKGQFQFANQEYRHASIEQKGKIEVTGDLVFLGANIHQEGASYAREGNVMYGSGEEVLLRFQENGQLVMQVTKEFMSQHASQAPLRPQQTVMQHVMNKEVVVKASHIQKREGRVWLTSQSDVQSLHAKLESPHLLLEGKCEVKDQCTLKGDYLCVKEELKGGSFFAKSRVIEIDAPITMKNTVFLEGSHIFQKHTVRGDQGVTYTGDTLVLGGDVMTDYSPITLHPDIYLTDKNLSLHTGYVKGSITLSGALDGAKGSMLTLCNGDSPVHLRGNIGKKSTFDRLQIISQGSVILEGDVGSCEQKGVNGLELRGKEITLLGSNYHAGSCELEAPFIRWESVGKTLKADHSLKIKGHELNLQGGEKSLFYVEQGDMRVDSGIYINPDHHASLHMKALKGTLLLPDIQGLNSSLSLEAKHILVRGALEAKDLHCKVGQTIGYEEESASFPSLKGERLTLYSEEGGIGEAKSPLHIDITSSCKVGSSGPIYLKGHCYGLIPHLFEDHKPPFLLFNEERYCYHLMASSMIGRKKNSSLAPILKRNQEESEMTPFLINSKVLHP
ncbi:MAG: filamentous hemagglutinin N-terminal domain-containing protein [Candidatus Rhabdochlamydia sp.]